MPDLAKQPQEARRARKTTGVASGNGQIVLVLQGGGALGAYQAGVYQALHEAGIEPDWVIGTSIGAINASLIAGNEPTDRLRAAAGVLAARRALPVLEAVARLPWFGASLPNWKTLAAGSPVLRAQSARLSGLHVPLGADAAGYYSTAPLEATLKRTRRLLADHQCTPRLTVGAANVRTSECAISTAARCRSAYATSWLRARCRRPFRPCASTASSTGTAASCSNTPVEAIFDDNPRRNSLDLRGPYLEPGRRSEPESIWQVLHRQKEIQYSSRAIPTSRASSKFIACATSSRSSRSACRAEYATREHVREMARYGCLTRMHVVRLLAPRLDGEDHTKDIDFSRAGIRKRWEAGYANTHEAIERAPWQGEFDALEGVILHEPKGSMPLEAVASSDGLAPPISLASDQYATSDLP